MPSKGTVKDPATGRFVKKARTREEILAELAALDAESAGIEVAEEAPEAAVQEAPKRESLRLQSKYREHTVSIIPTRRVFHPISGLIEPVPGLFAKFTGPQRIFDSLEEQKRWGWTNEQLDTVERKLVGMNEFMKDFYPAPLAPLPEHLKEFARVKEAPKQRYCAAFAYNDGTLVQCGELATAGRDWCYDHDPSTVKITKGGGTTVG